MKLEVGKTYRTRGGLKATVQGERPGTWPFIGIVDGLPGFDAGWTASGKQHVGDGEYLLDLVAEWKELAPQEPVPWEWFGHALHFSGGSRCRFHLGTKVGPWIVSTIGDYFPSPKREPLNAPIGDEKPLFYETMVFPVMGVLDCGCPDHLGQEADWRRYATAQEATAGHMELCRKWELVPKGGSPQ